jgi:glycerol-3-phosphate acyltransferase PlsY
MLSLALVPGTIPQGSALVISYLLGAIPFGLLLGFLRGVDVRKTGSGNIGATNVGRALGRPWAWVAFLADFAKGWVPVVWFAPALAQGEERWTLAVLCGCAAVCGHVWPVYLGFRGGKGVATLCGAVAGIDPLVFLGGGAVWLVTLATTRYVGLSSMLMGLAFPFLAAWRMRERDYGMEVVWGTLFLSALVFVRHRGNMVRMFRGTEPRFGDRSTSSPRAEHR